MKAGDILFTGAIATKEFADSYNRMSEEIDKKEKIGMDVEALKNGRHNFFTSYCYFKKR